jgi:hypothetical protein
MARSQQSIVLVVKWKERPVSAWSIGRASGSPSLSSAPSGIQPFVDRVVQWIPADVIAIYTVGITTLKTQDPDPNPSPLWLVIAAALAFILVVLAARRTRHTITRRDFMLAFLAVVAFAIWSLAIPESGWYDWDAVQDNPGWVALAAAVGGVVFGAFVGTFFEE